MLRATTLNHLTLSVSDPKRSLEFYQGLFGMPIQARQADTVLLRIGAGPQFLALGAAGKAAPHINHFCLGIEKFDVERVLNVLAAHGVTRAEGTRGGMTGGPMKARVRQRGPEFGGAKTGTPELYFGDPDGITVQLQDARYCGGAGTLGEFCIGPEPAPGKGLIQLRDLNHFTMFIADAARSNAFYQGLFGMPIRAYQGAAPTLAVGTVGFLMYASGRPGAPTTASINHVCLSMDNFDTGRVTKTLEGFGLKPRPANRPAAPMQWYITMRMPDRGGAKEGTPEYYFTDPDGILIQLQDTSYCGGSGVLGNECKA
jgi:catechol 2,3-dioxygenase-like lactoylglutathione lyase family enzyme